MDDPSDDLRVEKPRRIEILTGATPRRRSDAVKAKIVAESLEPGIVVTELARRHGVRASQIHLWRKDAREGRLVLPTPTGFAEVVLTPSPAPTPPRRPPLAADAAMIEIDASTMAIRVRAGADPGMIAAIIRALKS